LKHQSQKRHLTKQPAPRRVMPLAKEFQPIDLETSFLEEDSHHRWLLTSCIAGVTGSLIIGSVVLGLFGHNASPTDAAAAVQPKIDVAPVANSPVDTANLKTATVPVDKTEILAERDLNDGFAYPEITADELPYNNEQTTVLDAEIQSVSNENENITTITKTPPPEPVDESFELSKGSTLTEELTSRGVSRATAQALVASIEPVLPAKMIKAGTKFEVTFDRQIDFYGREVTFPVSLTFKPGPKETIAVDSDEDGQFTAQIDGKDDGSKSQYAEKPQVKQFRAKTQVGASLYATAKDNLIPDYIVSEFTRVFSYDVDFQRQVSGSDTFEVFYGNSLTGASSKRKVLHYARLTNDGTTKTYFRFTSTDGLTDYFDENGRSASRALLKTPISGAKLTSGFGVRRHPLLGYTKMHEGVDFGASSGTPIHAAGAGVIDIAGRHGGYGNVVVIKHNEKFKSMYAHMQRFAAGIRPGVRINQGQVIGYVGSTGRSTGPHLHYEVRINDRPTNPMLIRATGGKQLAGKDLLNFRINKDRVLAMMKDAPSAAQVAEANQ
jgi:murein DD-endopeptidase MepM/ murein hydrolase activator NlpD